MSDAAQDEEARRAEEARLALADVLAWTFSKDDVEREHRRVLALRAAAIHRYAVASGKDATEIARVFDSELAAAGVKPEERRGKGLGLASVRRVVDGLHGRRRK